MAEELTNCPICTRSVPKDGVSDHGERATIRCSRCGSFTFTGTVYRMLESRQLEPFQRAALMHRVRIASSRPGFVLDSSVLKLWLNDLRLPSPSEQIENLILWLAENLRAAGDTVDLISDEYQAVVGAADDGGFAWVLKQAESHGWVQGHFADYLDGSAQLINATLTLAGWQLADSLRKAGRASKQAFIAMKFGDAELDALVRDHLVPAVESTGFKLRALNEGQPAGLIDDQLRVAIRRARFILVDLTHGNRGAYWEAGFAEGLGKPVIYLCREDIFNGVDPDRKPHFDTSHLVTILWKPEAAADAASRLAACIRATLPDEAVMNEGD
jgi:hypothetical protein